MIVVCIGSRFYQNCNTRRSLSLAGYWIILFLAPLWNSLLMGSSLAASGTLEQADRLLLDPNVDQAKAVQAFTIYESLLPTEGAARLPVLERLARAAFFVGDLAEKGQRRLYYEQGRTYAQTMIQEFPHRVEGHYWLGMNLAGLADASRLQGMRLLPQILAALERSASLDAAYDQAGAYRVLGRIYYEAPGRPFSVGDINKSFDLLTKATALAPANSTNRLYLAETLIKLNQRDQAQAELRQVLTASQNADGPRGLAADQRKAEELLHKLSQ
ncbi:MAG: tetratricopeptide repeat protein [Deltaproteobacteria bacterium]|nr:tetratricopeptide repeat protein [Deltaproteobacteria bacterium]